MNVLYPVNTQLHISTLIYIHSGQHVSTVHSHLQVNKKHF